MMFIFEDNKFDKISGLYLNNLYTRFGAEHIDKYFIYVNGNGEIKKWLKFNYNINEIYYCFIDVIPDNKETIREYNNTIKEIFKLENYSNNVFLIPIASSECYVIKVLNKIHGSITDSNIFTDIAEYIKNCDDIKNKYHSKNYEKVCKTYLNLFSECTKQKLFYESDCKIKSNITLDNKSYLLQKEYPLYLSDRNSNEFDIITWYKRYVGDYSNTIKKPLKHSIISQ